MNIIEKAIDANCVLSLQALSEFYYASTRKKYLTPEIALEQIKDWQSLFPTVMPKPETLVSAIKGIKRYKLAFWDAMLWSTIKEAGVKVLLSEDFNHHQEIAGVRIINPFIDDSLL